MNFSFPDYAKYAAAAVGVGHPQVPEHVEGQLEAAEDADNVDDHQDGGVVLHEVLQGMMRMRRLGHQSHRVLPCLTFFAEKKSRTD